MKYALTINMSRTEADRISVSSVQTSIDSRVLHGGYRIVCQTRGTVTAIGNSVVASFAGTISGGDRANVKFGLSVDSPSLSPDACAWIDTAVIEAIKAQSHLTWSTNEIRGVLPANGSGSGTLNHWGSGIGRVEREVTYGNDCPVSTSSNALFDGRVIQSTDSTVHVGDSVASDAANAGSNAVDYLAALKLPGLILAGTVVVAAGAVIAWKVL